MTASAATAGFAPDAMFPALAARTAGKGSPFVLLHGGVGSSAHWVRNIDVLAEKFRVTAFDLPGYGDSPDVPKGMTPEMYIDWVSRAITTMAPNGCHLAGFSFGGALAARVAAQVGKQIIRLSLLGSGGFGVPVGRVIPVAKVGGTGGGAAGAPRRCSSQSWSVDALKRAAGRRSDCRYAIGKYRSDAVRQPPHQSQGDAAR